MREQHTCEQLPGHFLPILSPLLSSSLLPSSLSCWMVISSWQLLPCLAHSLPALHSTHIHRDRENQLPTSLCPAWCKASAPENSVWTAAATLPWLLADKANLQSVRQTALISNGWKGTFLSHSSHDLNWYGRKRYILVMVVCAQFKKSCKGSCVGELTL